jgi:hypothetical protein
MVVGQAARRIADAGGAAGRIPALTDMALPDPPQTLALSCSDVPGLPNGGAHNNEIHGVLPRMAHLKCPPDRGY